MYGIHGCVRHISKEILVLNVGIHIPLSGREEWLVSKCLMESSDTSHEMDDPGAVSVFSVCSVRTAVAEEMAVVRETGRFFFSGTERMVLFETRAGQIRLELESFG